MRLSVCTALAIALAAPGFAQNLAGFQDLTIPAPHHGRDLVAGVWYPTAATGKATMIGENPVFTGHPALKDAAVAAQDGPVVVLSHGLGGHFLSLAWLAADLAQSGAIVVGVNHPNSSARDFDMQKGLAHWTRAQDISAALDYLTTAPDWAGIIDPARISVLGFSFGGWTALSMGGVRGDHAAYVAYCDAAGDSSSHCADIARMGGNLAALDPALWNGDWRDARVSSVVAIDPGLTWGLSDPVISVPALLITLGQGPDRLSATDIGPTGSGFAALVPQAGHTVIAPAYHFSVLPLCKPQGAAILAEEKDDPVCTDPAGAERADIHAQVLAQVKMAMGL